MTEKHEKIVQTAGRDRLGDFAPAFAHYNDDILFGENWNNQDIDLKNQMLADGNCSDGSRDYGCLLGAPPAKCQKSWR